MIFLKLNTVDPHRNLAIEEYLFHHVEEPTMMLWQNAPSVILGKNQSAYAEVDLAYAEKHSIRIARRITGGGAVYHDLGNLNYTLISPDESRLHTLDFAAFSKPILNALKSLGINASLSGRNDLEISGKKFSGNAQYSSGGRVLHHGTLLFDTDFDVMEAVLSPDEEKIRSKAIRSVHARVINLRTLLPHIPSTADFCTALEAFIDLEYAPMHVSPPENEEIEALSVRNASADWLFPSRDLLSRYTVIKKKRYPFGSVEIQLDMSANTIKDLHITGDFFSMLPVEHLEDLLRGKMSSEIADILRRTEVSTYICGMDASLLLSLLSDGTEEN